MVDSTVPWSTSDTKVDTNYCLLEHRINVSLLGSSSRSSKGYHNYLTMDFFKYFKECFFKPDFDLPYPSDIDRLTGLPTELLAQIYTLLSPVDLTCLGLCNHRLYTLFKAYHRFPTLRADRLAIFIRLERDLPEYFACDICNLLHRYDGSESFGLSGLAHTKSTQLPCVRKGYEPDAECIGGSSISMRSHAWFSHPGTRVSFLQIKLAMRRYCYGPQAGINPDSLAFTQVIEYKHPSKRLASRYSVYQTIKTLFSVDAQVCPKPLGVHIRMQDILLYDIWEDSKIERNSNRDLLRLYEICQHASLESKASDINSLYHGRTTSFPYTCPKCNTVSVIEFCRIDYRLALVMTRWVNLGPGIRREDPRWQMHIFDRKDRSSSFELPSSLKRQSPRTCFENTTSLSFEDFRSRNISYLCGDRYKQGEPFAVARAGHAYHISYKEPSRRWGISFPFLG